MLKFVKDGKVAMTESDEGKIEILDEKLKKPKPQEQPQEKTKE